MQWAGAEVASRIVFTDVASKAEHVHRGRVADLFLDTTEVCFETFQNSLSMVSHHFGSATRIQRRLIFCTPERQSSRGPGIATNFARVLRLRSRWQPVTAQK